MPSSNPLWFGYYPGDRPVVKRPDKMMPSQPIEITNMGLNEALDEAINAVGQPAEMPHQLWEWITDDWKLKFTAHASPYVPSGADLYTYGTGEEVADVRGVYIPLNLVDLARDPKKTISKFIERSLNPINPLGGDMFESEFWTDLDTSVERAMWRDLIKHERPTDMLSNRAHGRLTGVMGPINFSGQDVFKSDKMFSSALGADVVVSGAVDVYEQAGQSVLNFVAKKKSGLTRNGAYSEMQTSFIQAASTELSNRRAQIAGIIAGSPMDLEISTKIDGLIREGDLVGDLGALGSALSKVEKEITTAGFTGTVTIGQVQGKMAGLDAAITQAELHIAGARRVYAGVPQELARFNRDVAGLESSLRDLRGFSGTLAGRSATDILGKLGEGESILTNAAVLSNRFSNNRYGGGISEQYMQSVGRRTFEGSTSLLNVTFIDPATGRDILSDGYRSLHTVYDFQRRAYLQEDGRDLLKQISKGELGKNYLWIAQLRDRVQVFTPAYWTAKVMDRTRFFGLIYNEKVTALHPIFDKSPLIRKHYFTESFDVMVGGIPTHFSGRFKGSKHLGSFHDAWSKATAVTGNKLIGVRDPVSGIIAWGNSDQNMDGFFALLNGNHAGLNAWVGEKDWTNLTTKFADFKADLQTAGIWGHLDLDRAGNVINNNKNKAILGGLFGKIGTRKANAANLDPFAEKFGALQIYTSKLSIIQQEIFKKLKLKKLADPFIRLRTAAAQKIASIVSKLAIKTGIAALGVATGGLAELLAPIIEKILQAIVSKVIDKGKDILKAILKGDFSGEFSKMMDDAMNATQKVITCGCIVPIITSFAILLLMGTVITSISPVDRSKAPSSSASTGGAETPVTPPGSIPPASSPSCVFPTWTRTNLAYSTATVAGHGSNVYYAPKDGPGINGLEDCSLSIPYFAGSPAKGPLNDTASWCNNKASQTYFGYALDVVPQTDPVTTWTIAPKLGGVTTWAVSKANTDPGYGCAVTLNGNDGTNTYAVHILHLRCGALSGSVGAVPSSVAPGQAIAVLYDYSGGRHAHLEMQVGGVYKKPQDYLCP